MDHLAAQYGVFFVEAHFRNGYSLVTTRKTELFVLGTWKFGISPSALSSQRETVWWGFASSGVIGPYFFETSNLAAVTVTFEHYLDMLRNVCEPESRHRGIHLSSVCFQQDGATSRAARASLNILPRVLPQHATAHEQHIPHIYPHVLTFWAVISNIKCSSLSLEPSRD